MNKTLLIEGVLLLAMGVVLTVEGVRLMLMKKIQLYDAFGPGRYTLGLGLILLTLSATYLMSERKTKSKSKKLLITKETVIRVAGMIITIAIYIYLIPKIGYAAASGVFFLIVNRIVGHKSWIINGALSIGFSIAFYLIFARWLHLVFPRPALFH